VIENITQGLLACLLLTTVIWCMVINRRLSRLRSDQSEMRELILALNEATQLAEKSIIDMRRATLNAEQRAREQEAMVARRAQELRELMARSSQIAMKLEAAGVPGERGQAKAGRSPAPGIGQSRRTAESARAHVQPAEGLSELLTRQEMLAALERVQ